MALTGIQIFKMLPGTNCKKCGSPTCLAFAMNLASGKAELDSCPDVSPESREKLSAASAPPIRPVTIGYGDTQFKVGGETVQFRHEKTFFNPTAIGAMITDDTPTDEIVERVKKYGLLQYGRVGLNLRPELVVIKANGGDLALAAKTVVENSDLSVILYSEDPAALKAATAVLEGKNPLIGPATTENAAAVAEVALAAKVPVWLKAKNLDEVAVLTDTLGKAGLKDLVIDTGARTVKEVFTDSICVRRAALVGQNRAYGFGTITFPCEITDNLALQGPIAASLIAKYAGIVVLSELDGAVVFPLLLERLNIFTDPQRPMTVVEGIYPINNPNENSPVMVTTNFSLTYFIVSGEVEGSRVPSWLLIKESEGLSVLTAWAAGKFSGDDVGQFVGKRSNILEKIKHKSVIIPGYAAAILGDMEEELPGWTVSIGPREAAHLPKFLKEYKVSGG
ncbi:MAG: acetyl-CoA decarbonylase/synthase complex subunit gamma [Deltaproteobacteria bacterium]|jgi:acetyl-CoA decarbonylase/synthase complex subunit gamma|nr:acetyl-CoA decarbonylase/synthase complex subunit gamma [Deltaproteobacteria bacterium]